MLPGQFHAQTSTFGSLKKHPEFRPVECIHSYVTKCTQDTNMDIWNTIHDINIFSSILQFARVNGVNAMAFEVKYSPHVSLVEVHCESL